jgi:hypothetical protein
MAHAEQSKKKISARPEKKETILMSGNCFSFNLNFSSKSHLKQVPSVKK